MPKIKTQPVSTLVGSLSTGLFIMKVMPEIKTQPVSTLASSLSTGLFIMKVMPEIETQPVPTIASSFSAGLFITNVLYLPKSNKPIFQTTGFLGHSYAELRSQKLDVKNEWKVNSDARTDETKQVGDHIWLYLEIQWSITNINTAILHC